jgi:hypothetical protein
MPRGFRDEDDEPATFDGVKCVRATPRAILCLIDGAEVWIPQSVVDDTSEVFEAGNKGRLVVQAWFARKELNLE